MKGDKGIDLSTLPESVENIILITVDCLRADHLELYGYKRTMPKFNEHVRGFVVEQAYANAPFTLASFPSIFTSSYPLEGDPFYTLKGRPEPIHRLLQRKGFRTAGFNTNLYLSLIKDYERGFDYYWSLLAGSGQRRSYLKKLVLKYARNLYNWIKGKPKLLDLVGWLPLISDAALSISVKALGWPDANALTMKVLEWIKKNKDRPFFLWIHYMDVHNPYFIGNDLKRLGKFSYYAMEDDLISASHRWYAARRRIKPDGIGDLMNHMLDIYDRRISRVDASIGKIIKTLEDESISKETAIILTSDHGQGALGAWILFS